jgi:predicted RNase H-like nuclease (RuvC/YqgF family)
LKVSEIREVKTREIKERKPEKVCKEDRLKALERSYEIAKEYIERLEKRVKELEEQRRRLLEERIRETQEIRKELMRDREIELRDNIINNLRAELQKERELRKKLEEKIEILEEERYIESQGLLPIVRIEEFSRECIASVKELFRIFNRIILFEKPCHGKTVTKYLISLRPKAVIGSFGEEEKAMLEEENIPVLAKSDVEKALIQFKRFYGIEPDVLKSFLEKERKKSFLKWLESYRKRFL